MSDPHADGVFDFESASATEMNPPRVAIDVDRRDPDDLAGRVAEDRAWVAPGRCVVSPQRKTREWPETLCEELNGTVHQGGNAEGREEGDAITTNLRHIRPPVERALCGPIHTDETHPQDPPISPGATACATEPFLPNLSHAGRRGSCFSIVRDRSNPNRPGVRDQTICEHAIRHIVAFASHAATTRQTHPCKARCCVVLNVARFMKRRRGLGRGLKTRRS